MISLALILNKLLALTTDGGLEVNFEKTAFLALFWEEVTKKKIPRLLT